jgi:hypothetical protein
MEIAREAGHRIDDGHAGVRFLVQRVRKSITAAEGSCFSCGHLTE